MTPAAASLILASTSPRRHDLLERAGVRFTVVAADVDETPRPFERPEDLVTRLARDKAVAVAAGADGAVVLGADTVVALGPTILGKPSDAADAARMLQLLSGSTHHVITGVCVLAPDTTPALHVETTLVTWVDLTDDDIAWYVATGEPLDKAGAYGIQGGAARFVERVDGSHSNIVGLPLAATIRLLRAVGVPVPTRTRLTDR